MTAPDRAAALAIERLVNVYVRDRRRAVTPGRVRLSLRRSRGVLVGHCRHRSLVGHHGYEAEWWLEREGHGRRRLAEPGEVARLLSAELDAVAGAREELAVQVEDSVRRTRRYLRARTARRPGRIPRGLDAEQRVLSGHILHPTPKAAGGFTDEDTARFAPELGARFPLAWLALRRRSVTDVGDVGAIERVTRPVRSRLPDSSSWCALPLHPWQHAELVASGEVDRLDREVVDLGVIGPPVAPTSSVRTVRLPWAPLDVKLPLEVRVTNFVRTNPAEQLRRSRDADTALEALDVDGIDIRREPTSRTPTGVERWADLGVLVRESPPEGASVVAALLEEACGPPPIVTAAGGGETRHWMRRYAEVTVGPLARALVRAGVSLEAHVQNALVVVGPDGDVERLVVRDLEGTSLDRGHPRIEALTGPLLEADSPALYPTGECWRRFAYYVLINHVGHVVSAVARHLPVRETALWHEVEEVLGGVAASTDAPGLRALLEARTWPAKANLASLLLGRSEQPLYAPVGNPLRDGRSRP